MKEQNSGFLDKEKLLRFGKEFFLGNRDKEKESNSQEESREKSKKQKQQVKN